MALCRGTNRHGEPCKTEIRARWWWRWCRHHTPLSLKWLGPLVSLGFVIAWGLGLIADLAAVVGLVDRDAAVREAIRSRLDTSYFAQLYPDGFVAFLENDDYLVSVPAPRFFPQSEIVVTGVTVEPEAPRPAISFELVAVPARQMVLYNVSYSSASPRPVKVMNAASNLWIQIFEVDANAGRALFLLGLRSAQLGDPPYDGRPVTVSPVLP